MPKRPNNPSHCFGNLGAWWPNLSKSGACPGQLDSCSIPAPRQAAVTGAPKRPSLFWTLLRLSQKSTGLKETSGSGKKGFPWNSQRLGAGSRGRQDSTAPLPPFIPIWDFLFSKGQLPGMLKMSSGTVRFKRSECTQGRRISPSPSETWT